MIAAPFVGAGGSLLAEADLALGGISGAGLTLLTRSPHNYTELLVRHTLVGLARQPRYIATTFVADLFRINFAGGSSALLPGNSGGIARGYLLGGNLAPHYDGDSPFTSGAPGFSDIPCSS